MHTYQELDMAVPKEFEALKTSVHRFAKEVLRPVSAQLGRMAELTKRSANLRSTR